MLVSIFCTWFRNRHMITVTSSVYLEFGFTEICSLYLELLIL